MRGNIPELEFWYDFASTYSYLSAMRIEAMAQAAGVKLAWRPFLLGPIFQAQGWSTSPFRLYASKGRYMRRDVERLAAERGLAFALPHRFPANSLAAARLAIIGAEQSWIAPFTRAIFAAQFAEQADIADHSVLRRILDRLGLDQARLFASIEDPDTKARLRQQTAAAQARGVFGAPSFFAGEELFWGDDRLGQALAYARRC